MNQEKLKNRGITLIALIITIIVMLILVGVTISIALNGGLIEKAKEAKTKTERAQKQEEDLLTGRIKIEGTWYNSIDDYMNDIPSDNQNDEASDIQVIGGTAEWEQDEKGNITYKGKDSGLKVGNYVDYEKYVTESQDKTTEISELYDELTQYSGYKGKKYGTEYPIEKENTLKWQILDIKDGKLRLISAKPTTSQIYLKGYNGYNNAVYLIDKVCRTLYSTKKGTAQNLKIEDIQNLMETNKANGGWDYKNYTNTNVDTGKYGGASDDYIGENSYYPIIFEKEKTGWVNGIKGTELNLSEQEYPINQSEKMPASPTEENKIKVIQTYWDKAMSEKNWINPIYQNIFIQDSSTGSNFNTYWLSSRCVYATSTYARFDVRYIDSGKVATSYLYYSSERRSYKLL